MFRLVMLLVIATSAPFVFATPQAKEQSIEYDSIPNFPCYRTVEGTYQTAVDLTESHPNLAEWIDIGDSWEKTADEGGFDLMVLKLTNRNIPGPKPKLFASSAIHAREYATAELMTRFAEHLVENYGVHPDITWILDHHEAHFLLVTNPDGRKKAEPQVMWRKNTNRNVCGSGSRYRGVDLNRNFDYRWGSVGSINQCSETYRGMSAASEPETQAIQNYLRSIFPDRRGPNPGDPAPLDTMGIYFDIHSYGELIIQNKRTPNDREITTFNRKLTFFNDYTQRFAERYIEQSDAELQSEAKEHHEFNYTYAFGYGDLGIASYLFELGTSFFQSCSYFEDDILPRNFPAFLYALKVLRAPYMLPSGPEVIELNSSTAGDGRVMISGKASELRYNNQNGTEPTQVITAAEFYVDTPPWIDGAVPNTMRAGDGRFNSKEESISGTLNLTGLARGQHTIFVRAQDADGNWGPVSALFVEI